MTPCNGCPFVACRDCRWQGGTAHAVEWECRTTWDGPRFAPTNRGPDHRHISSAATERKT